MLFFFSSPKPSPAGEGLRATKSTLNGDIAFFIYNLGANLMKIFIILLTAITFNVYAAPVNINKADAEQLSQSLNGIGLKKAMAIVKYRKENGAFKTLDDLTNVKGIGEKTVKKNKADILFSKVKGAKKAKKEEMDDMSM